MNKSTLIRLAAAVVVPGIVAYKLLWTAVQPKIERRLSKVGLPPNGVAANDPLSGDVSLYEKELAAAKQRTSPGYYPSINGAGLTDSERSGLFSAATFSGSFDVPNKVYA